MKLQACLYEIVMNEPDVVPLAGEIEIKSRTIHIFPGSKGNGSAWFIVPEDAMVGDPIKVESPDFLPEKYSIYVVKIKQGTLVRMVDHGVIREIELVRDSSRPQDQVTIQDGRGELLHDAVRDELSKFQLLGDNGYLKELEINEPEIVPLAGFVEFNDGFLSIYPKMRDASVELMVSLDSVVGQPVRVEAPEFVDTTLPLHVVKVRRGTYVELIDDGIAREVKLGDGARKGKGKINLKPSVAVHTRCLLVMELECGTNRFLGACLGYWECPPD